MMKNKGVMTRRIGREDVHSSPAREPTRLKVDCDCAIDMIVASFLSDLGLQDDIRHVQA